LAEFRIKEKKIPQLTSRKSSGIRVVGPTEDGEKAKGGGKRGRRSAQSQKENQSLVTKEEVARQGKEERSRKQQKGLQKKKTRQEEQLSL